LTLRVVIVAADPVRRLGLAALVTKAGHQVLESHGVPMSCSPTMSLFAVTVRRSWRSGRPRQVRQACCLVMPRLRRSTRPSAPSRQVLIVRAADPRRPGFRAIGDEEAPLLTPREIEVLAAIGNGLSNKAVARQLGISLHTVKFHVEALLRKLGASSRTEAVHKGLKQGLIEL
jgi:two-component system, NarL family, nitrate/nitrite response regulator NarL